MTNTYGIAQLWIILVLPVALVTGIVIMGKGGRSGSWWCMLFGALLIGAGYLTGVFANLAYSLGWDEGLARLSRFPNALSFAYTAGTLLFSAGFILHAFKVVRLAQRAQELERLTQAMAAQIQQ